MKFIRILMLTFVATFLLSAKAFAAVDHTEFIQGPINTGPEVTAVCLQCHEKQAEDVLHTAHWKWKGRPRTVEKLKNSREEYGKANLLNNFCTDVEGGSRAFCTKCHIGYGWTEGADAPMDKAKIDCLVCHAKKGRYKKSLAGLPDQKLLDDGKMDLLAAARSVGAPERQNCGVCHFFGGGGDAVKHGDMDSSLRRPKREHDIHMGGSADMTCQECHMTRDHQISGASTFLATNSGRVDCRDCHRDPHMDSTRRERLNRHIDTVACQTCHIPFMAKAQATKMSWDWSTVNSDVEHTEQYGKETFAKHKGSFVWGKNIAPEYAWYNGYTERYLKGDRIVDPSKTVYVSRPVGSIKDRKARIFPFKVHRGRQPMDSKFKYLSIFQNYGGLWSHYDWQKALVDGAKISGLPYSGNFEFVSTAYYGSINHEVVPREQALQCGDCHGGRGKRLDWKALGYEGDPMRVGGRDK